MVKGAVLLRTTALMLALVCSNVGMIVAAVLHIKSDAPTSYVVTKGDTLWDISNIFLDKPWLWPELWRQNTQIENPHLIYPGDTLQLRYVNGKPVIDVIRKKTLVLTPQGLVVNKVNPISTLPWSRISPFIQNDSMMDAQEYKALPTLLGDNMGTPRFSNKDYVLANKLPDPNASYQVVRKVREVIDSSGKSLGLQISHLSDAEVSNSLSDERQVVHLTYSTIEARQGDKLKAQTKTYENDLILSPAQAQTGEIVQNLNGNSLIAKRDIVIVNLGIEQVSPGTVFGIYKQGPDIINSEVPKYIGKKSLTDLLSSNERVQQPAFKVGELVVVRSFANASYAWITNAETHLRGGEIIAKP
jgi:hypothetical protein